MGSITIALAIALIDPITSSSAHAQRALAGSVPRAEVPAPLLTLRPVPELHKLALEVAEVLELRTGERVEVGEPPPPDVIEAVPTGHVALAIDQGAIVVVLGAAGGLSHDSVVRLTGDRGQEVDARAVALAVEALRDLAIELAGVGSTPPSDRTRMSGPGPAPIAPIAPGVSPVLPSSIGPVALQPEAREASSSAGGPRDGDQWVVDGFLSEVEPMLFARAYSGASSTSPGPRLGLGTGVGLCVLRHCLIVFAEMPMNIGAGAPVDTRYQYPTFGSSFYSRPFRWGAFTPGASVGFVTRMGYFDEDMGLPSRGLQTDLGARATVELSYELLTGLDLMAETGADLMLDRLHLAGDGRLRDRGDRLTPWAQAAVRYRL